MGVGVHLALQGGATTLTFAVYWGSTYKSGVPLMGGSAWQLTFLPPPIEFKSGNSPPSEKMLPPSKHSSPMIFFCAVRAHIKF